MKLELRISMEERTHFFSKEGIKLIKSNIDVARQYLAHAHAINTNLGRSNLASFCHKLLISTNLTGYGAEVYEKKAFDLEYELMHSVRQI